MQGVKKGFVFRRKTFGGTPAGGVKRNPVFLQSFEEKLKKKCLLFIIEKGDDSVIESSPNVFMQKTTKDSGSIPSIALREE